MASSAADTLTPRGRQIVGAARAILDDEGVDALTMRRIGARLGIRAPSLYKHFPDKQSLEASVISVGFEEQAAMFEAAIDGSLDPLGDLAAAYRSFARGHPHLYRLMCTRELRRDLLVPGVEARAGRTIYLAVGEDAHRARAAWAFAHGMTMLELDRRFPPGADIDAAWREGIDAFRPRGPISRRRA